MIHDGILEIIPAVASGSSAIRMLCRIPLSALNEAWSICEVATRCEMSARGAYDQRDQDEKDINAKARDAVYQIARLASYGRYEYHSIFAYPSIHGHVGWRHAHSYGSTQLAFGPLRTESDIGKRTNDQ